jgi:hypothetical protein
MAPSLPITERKAPRPISRGPLRQWVPPVLTPEDIASTAGPCKPTTYPVEVGDGSCTSTGAPFQGPNS